MEGVIALHYVSGIAVDSEVGVHLSTITKWLLVVLHILEDVQLVA